MLRSALRSRIGHTLALSIACEATGAVAEEREALAAARQQFARASHEEERCRREP